MRQPMFLRVREVAPLLGLSRSKTYELVMTNRLGSVLIDGCRRVPAEEVERFADKLKAEAGLQPVA
jgi:excisionase family DNA binding protein